MVTGRDPMPALEAVGAVHHRLGPMPPTHGIQLLARIVGEERTRRDPAGAAALVDAYDATPLAIVLAAGELVLQLDLPLRTALPELSPPVGPMRSDDPVRTAATTALSVLPPHDARFLQRLALIPAPDVDVASAAAATGTTRGQAQAHLAQLVGRGLVAATLRVAGRGDVFTLWPAVRAAAAEGVGRASQAAIETSAGYLAHLLQAARACAEILSPHQPVLPRPDLGEPLAPVRFNGRHQALAWLEAVAPAVRPALDAAVSHHPAVTCALVSDLRPLFDLVPDVEMRIAVHEEGLRAAHRWGDAAAVREMSLALAQSLVAGERHMDASDHYMQALTLAQAEGDRAGVAQCITGIGAALHDAGWYTEAEPNLLEAVVLLHELGDHRGTALAEMLLGSATARRGDTDRALPILHHAHAALAGLQPPDPVNAARALARLGEGYSIAGHHDAAVAALTRARREAADAGDRHWIAHTTEFLGQAAERAGNLEIAVGWYTSARNHYAGLVSTRDKMRLDDRIAQLAPGAGPTSAPARSGARVFAPAAPADIALVLDFSPASTEGAL
ncbi:hypothetical protein ACIHEI_34820 [Kitasatospora sp. NPDC051984]|uniref:hypothetical protein n=1 Tax=Kitasatospora sp. NPDC051984 TaxID=3364059 RepID=UPI0037C8C5DF